jgi:glycosyltransferase involved in cell wall biosynthesis
MKILHINTYDRGGAANACLRLHEGLFDAGVDSKVLVLHKTGNNYPAVYAYEPKKIQQLLLLDKIKGKIKRILREFYLYKDAVPKHAKQMQWIYQNRDINLEMVSPPVSHIDITNNCLYDEADIIHLHWVAGFVDYKTFFSKCKKPVVWTFHDQNPFLGIEHYSEKLLHPDSEGLPIRRIFSTEEIAIEEKYKQLKKDIFKTFPLHIVALSNWMQNEIVASNMFPIAKTHLIPNGIDSKKFVTLDKKFCRQLLQLPTDKKIILFASDNVDNNRKGISYLLNALANLHNDNLIVCSVGQKNSMGNEKKNFIELGEIRDQRLMNVAYSAADVFVIPSLMDNLPNTVIESLLSGTPVISFPVGGIPDMLRQGTNGYIATEISVTALSESIDLFFKKGIEWNTENIRRDAVERFDISVQVKRMLQLYQSVTANC